MSHDDDASYKTLFAAPEVVRGLILGFERPDSAAGLVALIEVLNEWLADNPELKRIFAISSRAIMGGAAFEAGDGAVGGVGQSDAGGGDPGRGAGASGA